MSECRYCGHERLLHDSWGCKQCGCRVSIIYLTSAPSSSPPDREKEEELIKRGIQLVIDEDLLRESHLRQIVERTTALDPPPVELV